MPDLIGRDARVVIARLHELDFKIGDIRYSYYPGLGKGVIIKQSPPNGYRIQKRNLDHPGGQPLMALIAPSILSADFARIGEAVAVGREGRSRPHPYRRHGRALRPQPDPRAPSSWPPCRKRPASRWTSTSWSRNRGPSSPLFIEAGADWISFHLEASAHLHKDVTLVQELGRKAGLALNPATPIAMLEEILPDLDFVLLMSVNPGWGGQKFIPCLPGEDPGARGADPGARPRRPHRGRRRDQPGQLGGPRRRRRGRPRRRLGHLRGPRPGRRDPPDEGNGRRMRGGARRP